MASEPKLFVYTDKIELCYADQLLSSEELIEIIEVDDNWDDHIQIENEIHGVCAIDADDQNVHSETEREDFCIEMVDKSFSEDEADKSEATDPEDQIELIEVEEDWVPEDQEAVCQEMNVKEIPNEISTEFYDRDEGRIGELRKSVNEVSGNSNFNKKGSVRKRKTFKMPLKQRMAIKKQILEHQHKVRDPCSHDNCNSIDLKRRLAINKEFWDMPYRERYSFGLHSIHRSDVKHRRKGTSSKKENHNDYFLRNEDGEMQEVCKVFYLTTLGFSKRNDNFVKTAVGNKRFKDPLPRIINRVDNLKLEAFDYASIIAHINSFKPNVSHHRRVHAPKKKYLPETLTIKSMYADFKNSHADMKCSYYLYRRIVSNELNISFAQLGHEQCETCEEYLLHNKSLPLCNSCDLCVEYRIHKIKYTEARELYGTQRLLNTEKKAFYSGDMEKVIMLPRLEMFKQAIFTTRLSAYNDTFAPLGGIEHNPASSKPVAVIWHEGISGRCKEDIISAFFKFFLLKRDIDECVMWLDNCSSQNKNWALFTFLVYIINSDLISTNKIQFNYFEPGHTFMSADSFHYQVERSMGEMKKLYDFEDFETAVSTANSGNVTVASMQSNDFYKWQDFSSRSKKVSGQHYMHEIVQVTATRGSFDLSYKKSFSSNEEFCLNFLQEKYKKDGIPSPVQATADCGISKERKENILKLSRILKEDKTQFYRNLPVSSGSKATVTASEQLEWNAIPDPLTSFDTTTASEHPKLNALPDLLTSFNTTASEQPKLNSTRNHVASKATATASERPKSNARRNPVASKATVSSSGQPKPNGSQATVIVSEQPESNAILDPVAFHATMTGSEQPKWNAKPEPVTSFDTTTASEHPKLNALPDLLTSFNTTASEQPKLNSTRNRVASKATATASERPKSNARRNPVASKATVSASGQLKPNASQATVIVSEQPELNAILDPVAFHATMTGSEQPKWNARPEPVVYLATISGTEQPKSNVIPGPLTSFDRTPASKQPKLVARPEIVVSHATMTGSEQPKLIARRNPVTSKATAAASERSKSNARRNAVASKAAVSASGKPKSNVSSQPIASKATVTASAQSKPNTRRNPVASKATVSASGQPKSNAKHKPVASQATVTVSEQPESNSIPDPVSFHATMTGSEQPKWNARPEPVVSHATMSGSEQPKLVARRNPVISKATATASERSKSNARRNPVASKATVSATGQPKSNVSSQPIAYKATVTASAQPKPNTRASGQPKLNTNKSGKKTEEKSQRSKSRAKQ